MRHINIDSRKKQRQLNISVDILWVFNFRFSHLRRKYIKNLRKKKTHLKPKEAVYVLKEDDDDYVPEIHVRPYIRRTILHRNCLQMYRWTGKWTDGPNVGQTDRTVDAHQSYLCDCEDFFTVSVWFFLMMTGQTDLYLVSQWKGQIAAACVGYWIKYHFVHTPFFGPKTADLKSQYRFMARELLAWSCL